MDANHIFFIYSLIRSQIVSPGTFAQLFISTHSLDFLKYLKRIPGKDIRGSKLERRHYIVERNNQDAEIKLMPSYLADYVTEFNYLFHQIHRCANAEITNTNADYSLFYNYGNNARKFLEAYLYYRYPNKEEGRLERFFGSDALAASLVDRVNNEYSHLEGAVERSEQPVDIPEMKRSAEFILKKIQERDPEQYQALVDSMTT